MRRIARLGWISAFWLACGTSEVGEPPAAGLVCEGCTRPSFVEFGDAAVGGEASKTVTLINDGAQAITLRAGTEAAALGPFAVSFSCDGSCPSRTLQPGGRLDVAVEYRPDGTGSDSAVLAFEWDLGAMAIGLSGKGVPATISCAPERIDFGSVAAGATERAEVSCKNTSPSAIVLEAGAIAGDEAFSLELDSAEIAAGATLRIPVDFAPEGEGTHAAQLPLLVAGETLATVDLLGNTPAPALVLTTETEDCRRFGPLKIGEPATVRIGLRNTSAAAVVINEIGLEGSDAVAILNELPDTIPAGQLGEVALGIDTDVAGDYELQLEIASTDPGRAILSTCARILVGGPNLVCDDPVEFGEVAVGTSATVPVQCKNEGSAEEGGESGVVFVSDLAVGGEYSAVIVGGPAAEGYAPGAGFTVDVTYAPTDAGEDEEKLQILTNQAHQPQVEITLIGAGS